MEILDLRDISKLRYKLKEIKKLEQKIVVLSQDEVFNKKALEIGGFDVLLFRNLEKSPKYKKHVYSGLNESLCKIAKKNNIIIGFDFSYIESLNVYDKSFIISQLIQNIQLCKKIKLRICVFCKSNFSRQDKSSFLKVLGASTFQSKQADFK